MKNLYSKESQCKFDRGLDKYDSPKNALQLAKRCTLGKKLMNQYRIAGPIMGIGGFAYAPFVYQMWEAEQAGTGTPFAIMMGLIGIIGSYLTYESNKIVRELQRRKELALNKASELEKTIKGE